jgi:hypothetical protein
MAADIRKREKIDDAPELGASVFLVETSVGELLPLFDIAQRNDTPALMLACLAASLEIDGERVSETAIRGMGASKWKALMRLGPRALRINSIIPAEGEEAEDDAEKKP